MGNEPKVLVHQGQAESDPLLSQRPRAQMSLIFLRGV